MPARAGIKNSRIAQWQGISPIANIGINAAPPARLHFIVGLELSNPPRRRAEQIEAQHAQRAGDAHERGRPLGAHRRGEGADD